MKKFIILFTINILSGLLLFSQNNSVYLDGSGDYMSIPDDSAWQFGTNDFTISFWITLSDLNRIHDGLIGRNDFQWLAMEYNHDGDHRLNLWIDSNGSSGWNLNNLKPSKSDWLANTWYNIAIVRSANTIKILIDGSESASANYTQQVYNPPGVPLYFGRSQLANRTHHGQMEDIRIWNYALSDEEFQATMNLELNGTEPGLLAYWKFDESTGNTAYDSSPNGHHCTLYNDATFVESDAPIFYNLISDWSFVRDIDIVPATTMQNYQIMVQLTAANFDYNNVLVDGDDLRFFTMAGDELFYWIDDWNAFGDSRIWINIPSAGTSNIMMVYGNPEAIPQSDGYAVFDYFEDFESGFDNWTFYDGTPSIVSQDGNQYLSSSSNTNSGIKGYVFADATDQYAVNFSMKQVGNSEFWPVLNNNIPVMCEAEGYNLWYEIDGITSRECPDGDNHLSQVGGSFLNGIDSWNHFSMSVSGEEKTVWVNDNFIGSFSDPTHVSSSRFGLYAWEADNNSGYDNIFIRNYSSVEPDVTVGAEFNTEDENAPFSPVDPTGLPYTIILANMNIDGDDLPINSQIAVFDEELCVGAVIYTGGDNLQLIAWEGDEEQGLDGFTSGHPMTFKIRTTWFSEIEIFDADVAYTQGNGNFGYGTFSVVDLAIETGLVPDILVSEDVLNFQILTLGESSVLSFIITNTGNTNLSVSSISSSSSIFNLSAGSTYLASGESDTVYVTFTPTENFDYNESVTIISDASNGTQYITLHGTGIPQLLPELTVTPAQLNFGGMPVNTSAQLTLNMLNSGNIDLIINQVSGTNAAFTWPETFPQTISPGDYVDLHVTFTPTDIGGYDAAITIENNDQNINIPVIGFATEGHFQSVEPTGLPYNILIDNVDIQGFDLEVDDEVAIFDDELCVGVANVGGGVGYTINLDGNGDYVNLGNPAALQITGSQTIEMWINPSTFNARRNPWAKAYAGEGTITLETNGTLNYFYGTGGANNSPYQSFTTASPVSVNTWTHIAIVRDLENMQLKWYFNGVLVNQVGASYSYAAAGPNTAYIGAGYVGSFAGMIDEVRVWNVPRTQEQIVENLWHTVEPYSFGLAGYWSFESQSALDLSLNGNNGTLYGNAYFSQDGIMVTPGTIQLIAWENDESEGLPGFIDGNQMSFKIWTTIYETDVELDATVQIIEGDGTFGFDPFSTIMLTAESGLEPDISIPTENLYVGQLEVNQSVESVFMIYNDGNAPMQVSISDNSDQFAVDVSQSGIPAFDSLLVTVAFSPTYAGNHTGNVTVISNDPDTPVLIVSLEGFALPVGETDIGLSTNSLGFNGVVIDSSEVMTFNVINLGTAPLNVSNITSGNGQFLVSPTNFILENTNDNQEVQVVFTPTSKAYIYGILTVLSNAASQNIDMSGVGYEGHFVSVNPTGLPYNIVIDDNNLSEFLEIGDEIAIFDGELCVGSTPVFPSGRSLQLDGSGDYMQVQDSNSLDLEGNQMTVESWVYINSFAGDLREIIGKIGWTSSSDWSYNMHIYNDGTLHFNFVNTSGTSFPLNSPSSVGNNAWHHVAATYDGTHIRMYINGIEAANRTANGNIRQNNQPVRIGTWWNNDPNYFNGLLDEIRVWDYARTIDEIQVHMNTELTGLENGLRAYWKFDGNGLDSSPNNNHGVMVGNATPDGEQYLVFDSNLQIVAWQQDESQDLEGFVPGNDMSFQVWSAINDFPVELSGNPQYIVGDGTFGYGQFSVLDLEFDLPGIMVSPDDFFFALNEPDSTDTILLIENTGDADLEYIIDIPVNTGVFNADYFYSPGTGASPPFGDYVFSEDDQFINSGWGNGGPGNGIGNDDFQVRWTGNIFAETDGNYSFRSATDDGARLYIDDQLIINEWFDQGGTSHVGTIDLLTGYHELVFEYYENGGGASCYLYWTPPEDVESLTPSAPIPDWLSLDILSGVITSGDSHEITMSINSTGLLDGIIDNVFSIYNNVPNASPIEISVSLNVTGSSQIVSVPEALEFDEIIVGDSQTLGITLQNIGTDVLTISEFYFADTSNINAFQLASEIEFPLDLSPLNAFDFNISFNPSLDGLIQDNLFVISDAANTDSLLIGLSGTGLTPADIALSGTEWSGLLQSGTVLDTSFTIYNNGQAALSFDLTHEIPWLSLDPAEGEILIADSSTIQLSISGIGVFAGSYSEDINIASNDPDSPLLTFTLNLDVEGEPEISSEDAVEFGIVAVGGVSTYDFVVENSGTDVLTLDSLLITGDVFSTDISRYIESFPAQILPGNTDTLGIYFEPIDNISFSEVLTLFSDAVTEPERQIVLHGTGYEPPNIQLSDTEISQTLHSGEEIIQYLTINNVGNAPLDYQISLAEPGRTALSLDGNGDYVNIINSPSLNPVTGLTIEGWLWLNDNNNEYIVAKEQISEGTYRFWVNSDGYFQFSINSDLTVISATPAPVGEWVHTAAVFDGTVLQIYVNGDLDGESVNDAAMIETNNQNLRIGRSWDNHFFNGKMDEIRLWNLARNQSEIQAMMNQSLMGLESGLALYMRYDEEFGNIARDDSPNENDGTYFGNAGRVTSSIPINDFLTVEPLTGIINSNQLSEIELQFTGVGFISNLYEQMITIESNDPDESVIDVPVTMTVVGEGFISASSISLEYSDTYIGITNALSLTLVNDGAESIAIFNWEFAHPDFSVSIPYADISPLSNRTVNIYFAPTSAGLLESTLTINSNASNDSEFVIDLSGIGVEPPIIQLEPDSLIVELDAGTETIIPLNISNLGGSDLNYSILSEAGLDGGNALNLDGTGSAIIQGPDAYNSSILTVETWIHPDETNTDDGTTVFSRQDNSGNILLSLRAWSGQTTTGISESGYELIAGGVSSGQIPYDFHSNQWTHTAVVLTVTAVQVFLNGTPVYTMFITPIDWGNAGDFLLGKDSGGHNFAGGLEELRIWDTSRSQTQLNSMKTQKLTAPMDNLVGYYTFDDHQLGETFISDESGYGNPMTLLGNTDIILSTAPLSEAGSSGLTWLSLSNIEGIVPSSDNVDVPIGFNALGLTFGIYESNIIVSSNDIVNGSVLVPLELQVNSSLIYLPVDDFDFGLTSIESSSSTSFIVHNTGNQQLEITGSESSSDIFVVDTQIRTLLVEPGDSLELNISFHPTDAEAVNGTITLFSNAGNPVISLSGTGYIPQPEIEVSIEELVLNGDENTVIDSAFTILNSGEDTLTVNIGSSLSWASIQPPEVELEMGEEMSFQVTIDLDGILPGNYVSSIVIQNNDTDENPVTLPLSIDVGPDPQLELSENSIDISMDYGVSLDTSFVITNTGDGTLGFEIIEDTPWINNFFISDTLASGEFSTIEFSMNSSGLSGGYYTGEIFIQSNDVDTTFTINLEVIAPAIQLGQAELNASVMADSSTTRELMVYNTGLIELEIQVTGELTQILYFDGNAKTDDFDQDRESGSFLTNLNNRLTSPNDASNRFSYIHKNDEDFNKRSFTGSKSYDGKTTQPDIRFSGSNGRGRNLDEYPWLSVDPELAVIPAGDSLLLVFGFDADGLESGTLYEADIYITHNDLAQQPEPIDVSFYINNNSDGYVTDDNENNAGDGIPDNDLDITVCASDANAPIEFNIVVNETEISTATLALLAYDVDEEDGEQNDVFLNGIYLGSLAGANNLWSTTVFNIDPVDIVTGWNSVEIQVDVNDTGWCTMIDWAQFTLNEPESYAGIQEVILNSVYGFIPGNSVGISQFLTTILPSLNVDIETNIIDSNGNVIVGHHEDFIVYSVGVNVSNIGLPLPSGTPSGDYILQTILSDPQTNLILDMDEIGFQVGTPVAELSPLSYDFQNVNVGDEATAFFTIANTGDLLLTLNPDGLNAPYTLNALPAAIEPGEEFQFNVTFAPIVGGIFYDLLYLATNVNNFEIPITGFSEEGEISVNPLSFSETLNFGDLVTRQLVINNLGSGNLLLSISGDDIDWLNLSHHDGDILAGDSLEVDVAFNANVEGGNYNTILVIESNDVNVPVIEIPVEFTVNGAQLVVDPAEFSVSLNAGETEEHPLYVSNVGNGPLSYNLAAGAGWISFSSDVGVIMPGEIDTVDVTFNGDQNAGIYQSLITLNSNDPDQNTVELPVTMDVWGATLIAIPSSLNFGHVVIDTTRTLDLTLMNNGNTDLEINLVHSVPPFSVLGYEGTILAPEQSIVIPVSFTAGATIFYNETLFIETDGGTFNVPLTAVGDAANPQWQYTWTHHDFELTDILLGTTYDLTISNIGNIQLVIDDWNVSSEFFTVSETTFVLNVGQSQTIQVGFYPEEIAVYNGTINWTSNDIGTAEFTVEGKGFYASGAPHLTYVEDDLYYGDVGIFPTLGSTSTYFEYQVVFTDPDGNPPMFGYPKVGIDKNGDSDFLDPTEGEITMSQVDPDDYDYTDGKIYSYITQLPINQNLKYGFIAYDALGNPAIDEATNVVWGPEISNDLLDLSIFANDITFSDLTPDVGQEIVINATVHNNSDYPSDEFYVSFYEEDVFITDVLVNGLPPHTELSLSIEHIFTIDEFYPIKVVVDEDDIILEDNEYNNFAIRPVLVGEFSIPGAISSISSLNTNVIHPNNTLRFFGHADYVDSFDENANVSGAEVMMTVHETGATYTGYTNSIGDFNIYFPAPGILGDYSVSATITDFTLLTTTSTHEFTVIPYEPSGGEPTYDPVYGPDLYTHWWYMNWTGSCRVVNEPIEVTTWFGNGGNLPAEDITVYLYQDDYVVETLYFDYLLPGETQSITYYVSFPTPGSHSTSIVVDPENTIAELNEWNNAAGRSRYIYPEESDLSPTGGWISDYSPLHGQSVNLTFQVSNHNCWYSESTRAFIYDEYENSSNLIGVVDLDPINGGHSQYVYLYDYILNGPGWHNFRIVVDPDDWVVESNEFNQELSMSVFVSQPTSELAISNISISNYNPDDGDLLNFTATVWNNGISEADSFYVEFKMDGVELGEPVLVEHLDGQTNILVTSDLWIKSDCAHVVQATVDIYNDVSEPNEFNNVTSRTIGKDLHPSFWPYYWYSSISVQQGANLTLFSRIHNLGTFGAQVVPISWILKSSPTSNEDELLELDYVSFVPGSGYTSSQVVHQFWDPGDYVIQAYADTVFADHSEFCEINEHNNAANLYVHVYEQSPDLEILSYHISPTELNPDPDEPVDIYASFTNNGNVPTGPFWVKFLANSFPLGDSVYVENLGAHEDTTVVSSEQFVSDLIGTHVIRVRLDDNNQVVEYNEMNNEASRALIVGDAPDLVFSDGGGLWLSNPEPSVEELITITGVVENNGGATGTANMNFYVIMGIDTTLISTVQFTAEPYDSLDVVIPWYASTPYGILYADITDSEPPEFNTFNNDTSLEFGTRIQLVDPLADIQIPEDTVEYIVADLDTIFTNIDETQLIYEAFSTSDQLEVNILPGYRLSLNPQPDWYGFSTITVTANNIYSDSRSDEFIVFVQPLNDAPYVQLPLVDILVLEGTESVVVIDDLYNHFDDVDLEDILTFTVESLDAGLDSLIMGEGASLPITAYPAIGFSGDIRITATAVDDSLAFVIDTLTLSVSPLIFGCMDMDAENYNPDAHVDDGSCVYEIAIPMNQGWNWFSTNVLADDMTLNAVLSTLENNGQIIKGQSEFAQYTDVETGWFGSLEALDNAGMYMLKMNESDILTSTGFKVLPLDNPLPLTENWNWISYLPEYAMDIEAAMASIQGNGSTLKNQVGFSQYVPSWGFWFGTLVTLMPHDGFKIRMAEADTLLYPVGDLALVSQLRENVVPHNSLTRNGINWNIDPKQYHYSSSIMSSITDIDSGLMIDQDIALYAFTGDGDEEVCRGMVQGIPSPDDGRMLFPLTVYSNQLGETVYHFKAVYSDTDEMIYIENQISIGPDDVTGNPIEPLILNGSLNEFHMDVPKEYSLRQAYPNPFNPIVTIPYSLKEDGQISLIIYDINGREITRLVDGIQTAGNYQVIWNADGNSKEISSGIYFVRMTTAEFSDVQKILLVK